MSTANQDLVVLVDEKDAEIGTLNKYDAHRNPAQLHRAISVYLFNQRDELLIQKRSEQKFTGQRQWANTCCGNVRPGESYEECARRRLAEELGITDVQIRALYKFTYQCICNEEYGEHEMDQVFIGRYDGVVNPHPAEVIDYEWVRWSALKNNIEPMPENIIQDQFAPWFQIMLDDIKLKNKIDAFLVQEM